jgi:hypothetical protein
VAAIELNEVIQDIADAVVAVDRSRVPFKQFQAGVGPYGEPQLVGLIAAKLNGLPKYRAKVQTKRTPDLLIPGLWALEFKLARPFGDNGREAENWSVNLLHPYEGSVSLVGDCLKLRSYLGSERGAAVVVGYEHTPARIRLEPLLASFELIATQIAGVRLSTRIEVRRDGLCHPVHQQFLIAAWDVS